VRLAKRAFLGALHIKNAAPVVAHVLPLARGEVGTRLDPTAVAAIFINPANDDANRLGAVASVFALTPAEQRVLHRVLSGKNINEAAQDLGVASSTVRTHLDSVFVTTGVARQSELIRLVADIALSGVGRS
jgi:DNA-binding CsgD family transcriptional regulator